MRKKYYNVGMKIYVITISLLILNTYAEVRSETSNIKILFKNNEILPKYYVNNNYYHIKNCDKNKNKISIYDNNKNIKNYYINNTETKKIKLNNKYITIKCTPDYFNYFDYEFENNYNIKGYYFMDIGAISIIYNTDGYPVWYRNYENYLPYYTSLDKKGVLTTVLYDRKILKEHKVSVSNEKPTAYVLKYNIKHENIMNIITPYEVINGEKKYPPIDYHGFHETKTGYYFISYVDEIVPKITMDKLYNYNDQTIEKTRICNNFNKNILIRTPRIIKTDNTGLITWSNTIKIVDNYNEPTFFINSKLQDYPCIIDINHPNYVSTTIDESKITVGLRNNYIVTYDKNKKIIHIISNYSKKRIESLQNDIKEKILEIKNDPLEGVCGTHGGYINNKNEIILYDNRCNKNEASRAVIYEINEIKNTATMKKTFSLGEERCFTIKNGIISCNAESQGNAEFGSSGEIVINWGVIEGNNKTLTVYDNKYKKILEVNKNKNDITPNLYIIKYKNKRDTIDLEKNIKYILSDEKNKKNNEKLEDLIKKLIDK